MTDDREKKKQLLDRLVRLDGVLGDCTTPEKLNVLLLAWLCQAANARNDQLPFPDGFTTERAQQVNQLCAASEMVADAEPDLEGERLFVEGVESGDLDAWGQHVLDQLRDAQGRAPGLPRPRDVLKNQPVIRNPTGRGRPLSEAPDSAMHHGGIVKSSGPFGDDEADKARAEARSNAFVDSIERGIHALENGTSPFAPDDEIVPGAPVEVFDIFDVHTGEHLMIWRVQTRERSKHAS